MGDSLAVRLPKTLSKRWVCVPATNRVVDVAERTLVVQKEDRRRRRVERLASLNWNASSDYKFDRDEANGAREGVLRHQHLVTPRPRTPENTGGGLPGPRGVVSAQVLNEFVHVARRKLRHDWPPQIELALGLFARRLMTSCPSR